MNELTVEELRDEALSRERDYYLTEEGFLDFARDSGAAPDAQEKPHGEGAYHILKWDGTPDPEAPSRVIYKFKMVLWPRGSFKSTVFDIALVCWLVAHDPNIRILVSSETAKQARAFVEQAKDIIDSEWFKERFGTHRGRRWTQGAFFSELRTKTSIKEPTLQASGVGEVRTGAHWDFVIMDDVCSQENTRTPESIESLWFWFGETLAQLDPGCKLLVIGTLHHFNDIYCRIQKDPKMRELFEFSVHSWRNEDGSLFFPGRLTERYVENQKAFMPPRLFACFYENLPYTAEDQTFKPEYFHVIANTDVPRNVWSYIFTDFAFIAEEKKKGKADRTCFWVVALDVNRVAYVIDFHVGRWQPSDSVRIACDLWNRYHDRFNLKGLILEDTTHKELLQSLFAEVRLQTFIRPKIITIGGRNQETKDMRIEGIEPRFRRGDIYFAQSVRDDFRGKWKKLIDEMVEWPFSAHDDIPDAISDLDKQDKDGRYYCPSPPVGWRTHGAPSRHQPNVVDGRYNPDARYPAREFLKADQQTSAGGDLWQTQRGDGGPMSPGQELFRPRRLAPKRSGES